MNNMSKLASQRVTKTVSLPHLFACGSPADAVGGMLITVVVDGEVRGDVPAGR